MTDSFEAAVADAAADRLDRLGSRPFLVAATGDRVDPPNVLAVAIDRRYHAHRTFASWAEDEPAERAAQTFVAAGERERQARGRLAAELQSFGVTHSPSADPDALQAHLRGVGGTADRVAAGLLGALLVADRTLAQCATVFGAHDDERRASMLREIRDDLGRGREMADWLLAEGLDDAPIGRERVLDAAVAAIDVADEELTDGLAAVEDAADQSGQP